MKYIKVKWIHSHTDEPVLLDSEIDEARWEIRKVEVYRNGVKDYASAEEASGSTRLGSVPIPALSEIASDPVFEPVEITRDEFEQAWSEAHGSGFR